MCATWTTFVAPPGITFGAPPGRFLVHHSGDFLGSTWTYFVESPERLRFLPGRLRCATWMTSNAPRGRHFVRDVDDFHGAAWIVFGAPSGRRWGLARLLLSGSIVLRASKVFLASELQSLSPFWARLPLTVPLCPATRPTDRSWILVRR